MSVGFAKEVFDCFLLNLKLVRFFEAGVCDEYCVFFGKRNLMFGREISIETFTIT